MAKLMSCVGGVPTLEAPARPSSSGADWRTATGSEAADALMLIRVARSRSAFLPSAAPQRGGGNRAVIAARPLRWRHFEVSRLKQYFGHHCVIVNREQFHQYCTIWLSNVFAVE